MNNYLNNLFNLNKKVAVVIGAGGHLCGKFSESLLYAGCKVALLDIRRKNLNKVSNNLSKKKLNNHIIFEMNSTKKNDHQKALNFVIKNFGKVNILINGSGINSPLEYFKISEENWDEVIKSQINSTFLGCQIFGKYMVNKKSGSIINISSASSGPPLSKAFAYSASKAAIKNLTQNLAREWGEKGVRVNALRPGFFPTQWNIKNFIDTKRKNKILSHTPMKRFGKTDELTGAVLWLSSDSSKFVTGAEIAVDGGFSCMSI